MNKGKSLKKKEETKKIQDSLQCSVNEAKWWGVMSGFGESYLTAFAVFLKATLFQQSMVTSFSQLLASIFQLFAVNLTTMFKSRKHIVVLFVFLQALTWLLIIGVSFFLKNVWLFIFLASMYFLTGAMTAPAWISWMGDLVPPEHRGKYFSKRNNYAGMASFVSMVIAGLILEYFQRFDTILGFAIIFTLACVGRCVSGYNLIKQFEPKTELRTPSEYGFIKFLSSLHKMDFGIFTVFIMLFHLGVFLSAPLFVFYWLNDLHFSYLQLSVLLGTASISSFTIVTYWGKHADDFGNTTILWVTGLIVAVQPLWWYLVWFLPKWLWFPAAISIQVIGGFCWSGFNLSASNYLYDTVEPINRIRFFSYHNALKGTFLFLGGLIGGLLSQHLVVPGIFLKFFPTAFFVIMILSFVVRLIVLLFFIEVLKEVKVVKQRPHFIQFVATMPFQGIYTETIVGMNRTLKRFRNRLRNLEKSIPYTFSKRK